MALTLLIDREKNRYSFVQHTPQDIKFESNFRLARGVIRGLSRDEIEEFGNEREANSANQEEFIQKHQELQGMTLDPDLTVSFLNVREK